MRTFLALTLSLLLLPATTSASDGPQFNDRSWFLNMTNTMGYADLETGCGWAQPFVENIDGGGTSELYAIVTDSNTGLNTGNGPLLGELWICLGESVERNNPAHGPGSEQVVAFVLIIGDQVLGALGTVSGSPGWGFPPVEGDVLGLFAGNAIVVSVNEGAEGEESVGATLGTMGFNILSNPTGLEGYNGASLNGQISLRLFTPRNAEQEAAAAAIKAALSGS